MRFNAYTLNYKETDVLKVKIGKNQEPLTSWYIFVFFNYLIYILFVFPNNLWCFALLAPPDRFLFTACCVRVRFPQVVMLIRSYCPISSFILLYIPCFSCYYYFVFTIEFGNLQFNYSTQFPNSHISISNLYLLRLYIT